MIIDEADRMLDMGFEREMNQCLSQIKQRCKDKFTTEPGLFHSEQIKMNFISATLSSKVQQLGAKLMRTFKAVGFADDSKAMRNSEKQRDGKEDRPEPKEGEPEDLDEVNIIDSIPKQVKQFWMQCPTQYRLLYLLAFLYSH